MVFPIVAPPDHRGPWCEQFWIYIISESFHINMTYSGSMVLKKKIFIWTHPIFAFLRLSPLWRGPGPLFEQFRIPFTKGWFMPSLIEIGLLVLEKKIFSIVAPPDPRGPWCEQFWIYVISESFHVNMTYSGSVVLEKIFNWSHPIFALLRLSPLWRGPGPLFEKFGIPFTQGWFMPSLIEIGLLDLEKKSFKKFQCIFILLWLSPLGEGQPPSFEQFRIPSPQGWFVSSLVNIGPVVLEKKSKM
jgi:hypothetical protein